ncbi:MAG: hypothetical protein HKN82_20085 [Akkermansiaceae bacterium]|nr:hypothetical protein [Akkermansiaceae bacterium]
MNHWSWFAVASGDEVKFYRFGLGGPKSGTRPFETLRLPATADEIIYSGDRLGVRTGRRLQFFDSTRRFARMPKYDFELPEGTSELVFAGNRLGILTGRALRFYDISAGYKQQPEFDFTVPEGTSELVIANNMTGSWLGVRTGTTLGFYSINRKYRPGPEHVFTLPPGAEEIVVTGPLLVVKRGDTVSFFDFAKKVLQQPRLEIEIEASGLPPLDSLHGTMITFFGDSEDGLPAEIWAEGNNLRTEVAHDGGVVVSLQLGDTLYTFKDGSKTGKKKWLGTGLGSMGLINQIAEVKANGIRHGSREINGVEHHEFLYNMDAPQAGAVAHISAETSLPHMWISILNRADDTSSRLTMIYRDLEANVAIPEGTFDLPEGVTFPEGAE